MSLRQGIDMYECHWGRKRGSCINVIQAEWDMYECHWGKMEGAMCMNVIGTEGMDIHV